MNYDDGQLLSALAAIPLNSVTVGSPLDACAPKDAPAQPSGDQAYFDASDPAFSYAEGATHEHVHHLQMMSFGMLNFVVALEERDQQKGTFTTSHRVELQAECITQAELAKGTGQLAPPQQFADHVGDPSSYVSDDAHGTAQDHARWSLAGWQSGGDLSRCNTWAASDADVA